MTEPVVVGAFRVSDEVQTKIRDELPQIRWVDVASASSDERLEIFSEAEVIFGSLTDDEFERAERLCWLQWPWSGVPATVLEMAKQHPFLLSNCAGIHQTSMAEHVLMLMLALARQLSPFLRSQQSAHWNRDPARAMVDLAGATVLVVGTGHVGQSVGRLCQSLGMQVIGCRETPRATPWVDWVIDRSRLDEAAARADWVVCTCPETEQTRGMLDASFFQQLSPTSRFINVGRGAVVDQVALIEALQTQRIAGAGLDVTTDEPLPAESPLWSMENVLITPHVAGTPANRGDAAGMVFLRNLHAYFAGDSLDHLVYEPPALAGD